MGPLRCPYTRLSHRPSSSWRISDWWMMSLPQIDIDSGWVQIWDLRYGFTRGTLISLRYQLAGLRYEFAKGTLICLAIRARRLAIRVRKGHLDLPCDASSQICDTSSQGEPWSTLWYELADLRYGFARGTLIFLSVWARRFAILIRSAGPDYKRQFK